MLEKTVETYLVATVRCAGGDAYKFSSPARVSVPDRIVIFPPARIYFVELKRPGGKPSKGQLREHERLRALGCDVRVIDSREAVDAFVREAKAAPAPYLHVYEYPSPFGGVHREFEPRTWNGQRPARTVPLYVKPQTENSRADALTDKRAAAIYTAAAASITGHPTFEQWCAALVRAILAAPPVEQHEAAPCVHDDDPKSCYRVRCQLGNKCVDDDMSPRQAKHEAAPAADAQKCGCIGKCQDQIGCPDKAWKPSQAAPLEGTGNGADERATIAWGTGRAMGIEAAARYIEAANIDTVIDHAAEIRKLVARAPRTEVAAGHCERAGGCVCGGDLPRVREGCSEWVKSGGAA
uniref:VRR-NUC domain-containing protein n=1 Tax=Burkholderia anthina TaxID=179879 RepID=UPI001ABB783A|nr:VRR-NUC domain-containing protein [Burkholderia anthina]